STPGGAAVRGSAGISANPRRDLYLSSDDAGAFLRFIDLYGRLVNGRMWLSIDVAAMQHVAFSIRDFDLPDEALLQRLRDALTPAARQPPPRLAGVAPSRVRGQLTLSPGKIVVKDTRFFNKLATVTLEGVIKGDQFDLRGLLASADLAIPE